MATSKRTPPAGRASTGRTSTSRSSAAATAKSTRAGSSSAGKASKTAGAAKGRTAAKAAPAARGRGKPAAKGAAEKAVEKVEKVEKVDRVEKAERVDRAAERVVEKAIEHAVDRAAEKAIERVAERGEAAEAEAEADDRPVRGRRKKAAEVAAAPATAAVAPAARVTPATPPTTDGLLELARSVLGINDYRPGQRPALDAILDGKDVIAVMPTGSGKSLLYQLPSLVLPGLTVVVSPLIALIKDQIDKMQARGVAVVRIDSTLTTRQRREMDALAQAPGGKLLLTTPERMADPEFRQFLKTGAGSVGVSRFVVDEAHCVSQWGHDFRPAYLSLRKAIEDLGRPPVLATTATAPPHVRADILFQLGIEDAVAITTTFDRPNLHYEVINFPGEDDKLRTLVTLLKKLPRPGIVYCATVKKVEELHESLTRHGIPVAKYHGRMGKNDRDAEQERFMASKELIMIATNAFGLGVDKRDIRNVLHYHVPGSLEAYAQEAGRGGRDGKPTRCVLLFSPDDVAIQEYFLSGTYPTRRQVKAVYEALEAYVEAARGPLRDDTPANVANLALGSGVGAQRTRTVLSLLKDERFIVEKEGGVYDLADPPLPEELLNERARQYEARRIMDRQRLDALLAYVKVIGCRSQAILAYLGEADTPPCGRCDNCLRSREAALAAANEATRFGFSVTRVLDEENVTEAKPRRMAKHRVVRIDQPPAAEAAPATPPPAPGPTVRPAAGPMVRPGAPAPLRRTPGAAAQAQATAGSAGTGGRADGRSDGEPRAAAGPVVRRHEAPRPPEVRRPEPAKAPEVLRREARPGGRGDAVAEGSGPVARERLERAEAEAEAARRAQALATPAGATPVLAAPGAAAVPATGKRQAAPDEQDPEDDDLDDEEDEDEDEDDLDEDDLDDEADDDEDEDDLDDDDEDDDLDDDEDDDDDLDDDDDDDDDDDEDDDEDDDDIEVIDRTAADLAEEGTEFEGEITVLARKKQPKPPKQRPSSPAANDTSAAAAEARRRRRRRRRKRRAMLPSKSDFRSPVLSTAGPPDLAPLSRVRPVAGGPVIEYVRGPMRINMAPVASAAPSDTGVPRAGGKRRGRDRWRPGAAGGGRPLTAAERRAERRAERLEKKRRRRRRRKRNLEMVGADGAVSFFSPVGGAPANGARPMPPPPSGPPGAVDGAPVAQGTPPGQQPVQLGPDGQPLPRKRRRRRRRGRGGRGRPDAMRANGGPPGSPGPAGEGGGAPTDAPPPSSAPPRRDESEP